jgi:hypothetical protein
MDKPMRSQAAKFLTVLAGALALGAPAHAQQGRDGTIARLVETQGNVLVSRESGLASGNDQLRLLPGTRVITTAHSEVVVEYDDGCRVKLKENQRFEVERGKPCALLLAQDILVPASNNAIAALIGGTGLAILLGGAGGSAGGPELGGSGGTIPISPN